jgi:GMP synthase (glutamine-hydrolysing)
VNLLALIHGAQVRAGVFGEVVEARGHRLEEWSLASDRPPVRPLDDYAGVLVFGGSMHADQDDHHPWLQEETLLLQRLLDQHVPLLGVCLGAQLLARAAHAPVFPSSTPEIGWFPVELTEEARDDALLSRLPERFDAFQWHYYTHGLPACAVELARSEVCTQAFRLGECAWGVQFHPEVTLEQVETWIDDPEDRPAHAEALREETRGRIEEWNRLGRDLCDAFVDVAERIAAPA